MTQLQNTPEQRFESEGRSMELEALKDRIAEIEAEIEDIESKWSWVTSHNDIPTEVQWKLMDLQHDRNALTMIWDLEQRIDWGY